jgi:tRNA G18 (ribose-2'-O)-methylase SpoU
MTNYKEMIKTTETNGFAVKDEYKDRTLEELQNITSQDRLPFSVMFFNVTGSLNIGQMIRTAHAMGAEKIFILGRKKFDRRSCVGSHNYIPIIHVDVDNDCMGDQYKKFHQTIKQNFLFPILIETGGQNYTEYAWKNRHVVSQYNGEQICLVVGNEGIGIPEVIQQYSYCNKVSIHQRGVMRSINVSSAFAIVCAHMVNEITKE